MNRRFRIVLLLLMGIMLTSNTGAQNPEPVYIFPVQFQKEYVDQQEQTLFSEVIAEEMGSLFWMDVLTLESIAEEYSEKLANKVNKCKTPVCALGKLKSIGIDKVLFIRVTRIKRRVFEIYSSFITRGGKTLYKYVEEEHGGQSELKYAAAGIVEQLFQKEIEKHSDKITSIVETTAITSTDADSAIVKADRLSSEGNMEKALEQYKLAAKESPQLALPHIKIAEIELKLGNQVSAENAIDKALKIESSNSDALIIKAELLLERSNIGAAEKLLRAAVNKDNKKIKAYYMLGNLLVNNGKYKDALSFLERAETLDPDIAETKVNLGKIYLELHNYNKALAKLKQAIKLNTNLLAAYPPLAEVYEYQKQYNEACETYSILFEKMPDCAACAYNLGRLKEQVKAFEEAKKAYEQTIELDESFVDAYYNLGELLIAMGKPEESVGWLEKYVEYENRQDQQRYIKRAKMLIKKYSH